MKKNEAESQKKRRLCQSCGSRPWATISIREGLRRCLPCWYRKYFVISPYREAGEEG